MSSYPPTPQFGGFTFAPHVPPKPAAAPLVRQKSSAGSDVASPVPAPSDQGRRPSFPPSLPNRPPPPPAATTSVTLRYPLMKTPARHSEDSNDSMEEGEVSDLEGPSSASGGGGVAASQEREKFQSPMGGGTASGVPSEKAHEYQLQSAAPARPSPPDSARNRDFRRRQSDNHIVHPYNRGGRDGTYQYPHHSQRNDRYGAPSKDIDPPHQLRSRGGRAAQQNRRNGVPSQGHRPSLQHEGLPQYAPRPAYGNDMYASSSSNDRYASTGPLDANINQLRQKAAKALKDLLEVGINYKQLVEDYHLDPVPLTELYDRVGLLLHANAVIDQDNTAQLQPTQSPGPLAPLPVMNAGAISESPIPLDAGFRETPPSRKRSNGPEPRPEKMDVDRQAQELRRRLKERQDRARREAEAKAAELARARESERQEEERRRLEVEVEAARETFSKKAADILNRKIPPTPISSTPVAATVKAQVPQPPAPSPSPSPPAPKIPGLFLGNMEQQLGSSETSTDPEVVMKESIPPPLIGPIPGSMESSNGATQAEKTIAVRRKRPVAADLYSEVPAMKRKFGEQRSASVIIQVSDDEGESEVEDRTQSPTLSKNAEHSVKPPTNDQSDELRKKEAEIQRLREKIMSAQQKKRLKNGTGSAAPSPAVTPGIGGGPTLPPSLNGRLLPEPVFDGQTTTITQPKDPNIPQTVAAQGQENNETENEQNMKLAELLSEAESLAQEKLEKKRKRAEQTALITKKLQQEHERQERKLQQEQGATDSKRHSDSAAEQKRLVVQKMRAEMERLDREQRQIELRKKALADELAAVEIENEISPLPGESGDVEMMDTEDSVANDIPDQQPPQPSAVSQSPLALTPLPRLSTPVDDARPPRTSDSHSPAPSTGRFPALPVEAEKTGRAEPDIESETTPMEIDPPVHQSSSIIISDAHNAEEDADASSSDESQSSSDQDSSSDIDRDESIRPTTPVLVEPAGSPLPEKTTSMDSVSEADSATQQAEPAHHNIVPADQNEDHSPPNVFKPYVSPLAIFKSFRYHPKFSELFPAGLKSTVYSNKIDPFTPLCQFEVSGGVCNDSSCKNQHFRQLPMGGECPHHLRTDHSAGDPGKSGPADQDHSLQDDEILVDLAQADGETDEETERFNTALRKGIIEMKERGVMDFDTVAAGIINIRRQILGDKARVVKLPRSQQ